MPVDVASVDRRVGDVGGYFATVFRWRKRVRRHLDAPGHPSLDKKCPSEDSGWKTLRKDLGAAVGGWVMPNIGATVAIIGAVFILVGVVGGDLSYKGFRVPKVGTLPRFTASGFGILILLLGVFVALIVELPAHEAISSDREPVPPHESPPEPESPAEPESPPEPEPPPVQGTVDENLEALWEHCYNWDFEACDELYRQSPVNSTYEEFGATCGHWLDDRLNGSCVDFVYLYDLILQCYEDGNYGSCSEVYSAMPMGSDLELFGATCGWRFDVNSPESCTR